MFSSSVSFLGIDSWCGDKGVWDDDFDFRRLANNFTQIESAQKKKKTKKKSNLFKFCFFFQLTNLHRLVHHHFEYRLDGHQRKKKKKKNKVESILDWWLTMTSSIGTYLLRFVNQSAWLVRQTDQSIIPYDRFGVRRKRKKKKILGTNSDSFLFFFFLQISLITLLRMGLTEDRREEFYTEFLRLPLSEDMVRKEK